MNGAEVYWGKLYWEAHRVAWPGVKHQRTLDSWFWRLIDELLKAGKITRACEMGGRTWLRLAASQWLKMLPQNQPAEVARSRA